MLVAQLAGARAGYRQPASWLFKIRHVLTFESFLLSGLALVAGSIAAIVGAFMLWSAHDFHSLPTILPVVLAGRSQSAALARRGLDRAEAIGGVDIETKVPCTPVYTAIRAHDRLRAPRIPLPPRRQVKRRRPGGRFDDGKDAAIAELDLR